MYLHIGNETVIKTSEVVTILDAKILPGSPILQNFLSEKEVMDLTGGNNAKSIVVTCDHIYLSPLGSAALKRKSVK